MIRIDENSVYSKRKIDSHINKYTRGYYTLKKEEIEEDMDKYHDLYLHTKDKKLKKRYREVLDYLTLLNANIVTDYIKAIWTVEDDAITVSPFKLQAMRDVGMDAINYVIKRDDKTIAISYRELWD